MITSSSAQASVVPAPRSDADPELDELQARLRAAEERVANLERALLSNRRIGVAVGILMCSRRLTDEQAITALVAESQRRNRKVRELAETLILTGTLDDPPDPGPRGRR
ncbi:ANTAR domain-containing protein [Pseudonocardia oroxyli]|uniref:ANTAR domain-containing protein n=1 Tax=Pseudonocardia oroxyli TaxID=366584 RepID=A0A1G7SJY3_PSEOR|nr:ANTAR domain-containing protein [Pseudonocardia oroxyli]SDG23184.1 ANTAR domain-containing protein [Pseudonocardia oroxyli]